MRIEPRSIIVRDVFEWYADNGDDGVFAYGGKLAIRPPYQREFVNDNAQSEAVIQTVLKGFPLNVMYWVKVGDEQYEVLDGQQRTLSVMQYLKHKFPITIDGSKYYWDALPDDKYNAIMDYEFMVYICEGNESVAIIPSLKSNLLEKYIADFDTVVIMKSGNDTDVIYDILKKYGLENNAIVSSCIGMENEIIEKIQKGKSYGYFTTVIVRK